MIHIHDRSVKTTEPSYGDTLYRIDFKDQLGENVDYVVNTEAAITVSEEEFNRTVGQLLTGAEQLLFSFVVPSSLSTTANIAELQRLVTTGIRLELKRRWLVFSPLEPLVPLFICRH